MTRQSVLSRKKRGPPATGKGLLVGVRIQPSALKALDGWITRQDNKPSRPEAIRRLLEKALAKKTLRRPPNKETVRKASALAAREIENLGDTSQPLEEQQRRKRRLIRGPSEFRDIRGDQPKTKS